ncbi:unnamed protein product [Candidula unifasciata]|uniref:Uncharacterized protein n=1 Tax=Candidula unifasciata TaxID=100452 RepID=A0A8S3Z2X5_9EUPU|nr:unnamed protein product [Candidula unifasciata]
MKKKPEGLDYLPTTGVRTDLKRFMNKFLEHNTVRYEQFVEVWRDTNMVYLCAGRASDREAREFVEKVLLIAQEYFLPPYQFQVRVGGLYLLYAIYQIQPLSPKVKIRLTSGQWRESVLFQQQAAQQNHLDVVYVFQRLLQEQAFLFCYTPSEMSIHSAIKETEETGDDLADRLKEEKTAVTSLFNYESLEKLSYIQDQYQQMKIGLAGPSAIRPDKSLDVALTELVEDVVVLLQSFKEKVSSFSRQVTTVVVIDPCRQVTVVIDPEWNWMREDVHVICEVETTGSRRQMLKSQAYSQPKSRTKTRQGYLAVNSLSTSPAKLAISGTPHVAHTDKQLPANTSSTQRPACSSEPQQISNTSDADDDRDQDYLPSHRPSPATSESTHCIKNSRREVLAEQNSGTEEPPQLNPPARKRGRPRKFSDLMEESCKTQNKKHPGQENYGQGSTAVRSKVQDVSHSQDSSALKNKVAFKFRRTEKGAEQPRSLGQDTAEQPRSLGQDTAEQLGNPRHDAINSQTPPTRRGRPRKCDRSENPEVAGELKRTFCADDTSNSGGKKARFELVVFPTGRLHSVLQTTSSRVDPTAYRTQIPFAVLDSSNLSQTVQQFTPKPRQDLSEIEAATFQTPDMLNNKRVRKKRVGSDSVTLTEIVVGKEVGKPAVIKSQIVRKSVIDKCAAQTSATRPATQITPNISVTQTSLKQTSDTHVIPGTGSDTHVIPGTGATDSAGEADDVEESQSSHPVKALKKYSTGDSLNRLKKRCRRQLEEDTMSVAQFVKRFVAEDTQAQLSKPQPKTPQETTAVKQPSVKSQHNSHLTVKSPHNSQLTVKSQPNSELPVKSDQQAAVLRKPSVKQIQQKIAISRKPSVKYQQNSELSVKCKQNTAVFKKLLSGPSVTTGGESPKLVTQGDSPHKDSTAKNTKTVSKDILPPWTSKRKSSSRLLTSPKQKFRPKIKDKTEVNPSLVQFRFL